VARSVPYEPRWPFVYSEGGVLFEFQDAFMAGDGLRIEKPPVLTPPIITSRAPTSGAPGVAINYSPTGAGDPPFWWSLVDGPVGLDVDPATGALAWTPTAAGDVTFALMLANDLGSVVQEFVVHVADPGGEDPGSESGEAGESGEATGDASAGTGGDETGGAPTSGEVPEPTTGAASGAGSSETGGALDETGDGCGCRSTGSPPWPGLVALAWVRRRRAPLARRAER
jgi:hypothetical protein